MWHIYVRNVLVCQRGNLRQLFEKGSTIQWSKVTKRKKRPTMIVKILDGKLNIKQDEQTKNGGQIVEWRVNNSCFISGTFLVTSGKNPRMIHEWDKTT
jgi:hypothetical protein